MTIAVAWSSVARIDEEQPRPNYFTRWANPTTLTSTKELHDRSFCVGATKGSLCIELIT